MVEAARGVPNGVWFNYRRVPAVSFARELIERGRIGRVFHYRATYLQEWGNDPTRPPNWKTQREIAGSGVLGDLLSHLADTALWLNGPVRAVSALMHTFAANRDIDDATLALARFANGSIGSFEATRYALCDWLDWMGLIDAGAHARIDRYIGYYEPYATSHDALDRDQALWEEVRNVARAVTIAVADARAGKLSDPASKLADPRPK